MRKITAFIAALMMMLTMAGMSSPAVAEPKNHWYCGPQDGDKIVDVHDPKLQVIVQEGADCTIENSTVKTVRAINTAHDVNVWNSEVVRGIHIMGATGTVHIGVKNCNFDPPVGNNVKVTKSHNVLICYVTTKNNIQVTGNDGRITLRNNVAGNNIQVSRNKKFVRDAGIKHKNAHKIRLFDNVADNHIQVFNNHKSREYKFRNNSPEPIVK